MQMRPSRVLAKLRSGGIASCMKFESGRPAGRGNRRTLRDRLRVARHGARPQRSGRSRGSAHLVDARLLDVAPDVGAMHGARGG